MKRLILPFMSLLLISAANTDALVAQSERFALVIGVTGYRNFKPGNRLNYADADARSFRDFILTPMGGGFRPENVQLVTNEAATRDSISRLIHWLRNRVQPSDILYVFFSGHTKMDQGEVYFMPYDAQEDDPAGRGWQAEDFLKMFRNIHPRFLVMFADACRAGAVAGSNAKGDEDQAGEIMRRFSAELEQQSGQEVVLLSSAGTQLSHEDPEFQQGLFTHYLLQALRGAADTAGVGNQDNVVTTREVLRFVLDSVERRSLARFGELQSPSLTPGASPTFPLAVLGADATRLLSQAASARDHFNFGQASSDRGDYISAEREYLAALNIDPNYSDARNNLGALYATRGRLSEAIAAYRETALRDPRHLLARRNLGEVALILHDTATAIQAFNEAAGLGIIDARLLNDLARANRTRAPDTALRYAITAARAYPDTAFVRITLGVMLSDHHMLERAIEQYQYVTQIASGEYKALAYRNLGGLLWGLQDGSAAERAYRSSLAVTPNDTITQNRLSRLQTQIATLEDSARRVNARFQLSPLDRSLYFALGTLYGEWLFRPDDGIVIVRKWLQAFPNDAAARIELGEELFKAGRYAEASVALDSAEKFTLTTDRRIALVALQAANDYALAQPGRAAARFGTIRTLVGQRPSSGVRLQWTFYGVRHHIRESQAFGSYRLNLLLLFEALQQPTSSDMLRRLVDLTLPSSPVTTNRQPSFP